MHPTDSVHWHCRKALGCGIVRSHPTGNDAHQSQPPSPRRELKPLLWHWAPKPIMREKRWEGRENAGMKEASRPSLQLGETRGHSKPKSKLCPREPWPALQRFGAWVFAG